MNYLYIVFVVSWSPMVQFEWFHFVKIGMALDFQLIARNSYNPICCKVVN